MKNEDLGSMIYLILQERGRGGVRGGCGSERGRGGRAEVQVELPGGAVGGADLQGRAPQRGLPHPLPQLRDQLRAAAPGTEFSAVLILKHRAILYWEISIYDLQISYFR